MKDSDPSEDVIEQVARLSKSSPFSFATWLGILDAAPASLLARLAIARGGLEQVTQMRPPRPGGTQPRFAMKSEVWMDGVTVYRISEEKAE